MSIPSTVEEIGSASISAPESSEEEVLAEKESVDTMQYYFNMKCYLLYKVLSGYLKKPLGHLQRSCLIIK